MTYYLYKRNGMWPDVSTRELHPTELLGELVLISTSDTPPDVRGMMFDANDNLVPVPTQTQPYQLQRRAAYPSIGDQLDALWKGGMEMEAMRQQVASVKLRYPKS